MQFHASSMEADVREPELEEEVEPGFSPSPDSEPKIGDDGDKPDQFFFEEEEELELEEGTELVSGLEKQRRLSFMGFEAAEILTGLKTGPLLDLSDSDSEEDIPIGQLRADHFDERLPLQSRLSKAPNKAPRKPSASKPSSKTRKKPPNNEGSNVEKPDARVPERPAVQQGVKGGKKKSMLGHMYSVMHSLGGPSQVARIGNAKLAKADLVKQNENRYLQY
jgi:hypothetical protein